MAQKGILEHYPDWSRCGNTSFFQTRLQGRPTGYWADPIRLILISVGMKEWFLNLTYEQVPFYNRNLTLKGLKLIAGGTVPEQVILDRVNALEAWIHRMEGLFKEGRSVQEVTSFFAELAPTVQELIFDGLMGLLNGFSSIAIDVALKRIGGEDVELPPQKTERRMVVVLEDSPTAAHIDNIARNLSVTEPVLRVPPDASRFGLETGLWEALETFGILEC